MAKLRRCFEFATATALVGWLMIVLLPHSRYTVPMVQGISVTLLCGLYVYLVWFARTPDVPRTRGSFFTFDGVVSLFQSPRVILAAWVHLLAFDLVAALYIKFDALHSGIGHPWLVPIYLLTMLFGPAGLLAYFLLNIVLTRAFA